MNSKGRIWLVDDEPNILKVMEALLSRAGFEVRLFLNSREVIAESRHFKFVDAIITDIKMPEMDGHELLSEIQARDPLLPVVMLTAHGTVESAVQSLKDGAFDYLTKPFDQTELVKVVEKAVLHRRDDANEWLESVQCDFFGQSKNPQIQQLAQTIEKIAPLTSTVLIEGESGTGKELVANEIHRRSPRVHKPYLKINCSAIPQNLFETELFGFERGAFTGASTRKPGKFELAHQGTVFLDEVGELTLEGQAKLLRFLQNKIFVRVGGTQEIKADVRIIAATRQDLEQEIARGKFREDLYYRLNVVPLKVPPLRERKEDIHSLAIGFLKNFALKYQRPQKRMSLEFMQAIQDYAWPGNVRQLENLIERLSILEDHEVLKADMLPQEWRQATSRPEMSLPLKELIKKQTALLEKELIERALVDTAWNVTHAADRLGLSRKGLQLKMKDLGLRRPGENPEPSPLT